MKNKKGLFIAVLLLAVGFATVTTTLYLNGTVGVQTNQDEFDIKFTNAEASQNNLTSSKVVSNATAVIESDEKNITFTTQDLAVVGEWAQVDYEISNYSTDYDAEVTVQVDLVDPTQQDLVDEYLTIETKENWDDDNTIEAGTRDTGWVKVSINKAYLEDAETTDPKEIEFKVSYIANAKERSTKADELNKGVKQVSFADDSWETIQKAVQSGDYIYQVGDTKTITLASHTNDCSSFSGDGTSYKCYSSVEPEKQVTVRVANTTECTNGETSQTGCGFVVEFVDITEAHNFNKADATNRYGTNVGGWRDSAMRTYVNGTLYNALPSDLQSVITNTIVVSGHGKTSGETNFITTDKLYLLNVQEVWGNYTWDTSIGTSRQLDYYKNLGVTESNKAGVIKQYNGSNNFWWLRSAYYNYTNNFLYVDNDGYLSSNSAYVTYCGISAAFRIA